MEEKNKQKTKQIQLKKDVLVHLSFSSLLIQLKINAIEDETN